MINPLRITNYARTRRELEYFWVFCIIVAGKNSDWAAQKVLALFKDLPEDQTPFEWIRANYNSLHNVLVANKVGQYGRIEQALIQSSAIDLATAGIETLTGIFGVGPKTARFFLLHSRREARIAVLDVHILRWMREECAVDDAPTQTPQGERYESLERLFLNLAGAKFPGVPIAEVDLLLWAKMSGRL